MTLRAVIDQGLIIEFKKGHYLTRSYDKQSGQWRILGAEIIINCYTLWRETSVRLKGEEYESNQNIYNCNGIFIVE